MDEARSPAEVAVPRRSAIVLANDHCGYPLKGFVKRLLEDYCDRVIDVGAQSEEPVDFPDVTRKAMELVLDGSAERAVLVCGTGAGACIAANKTPGIRAAVATEPYVARQAVEHDNVNVLCMGAWVIGQKVAADVVRSFLAAEFSTDADFRRRVAKLDEMDRQASGRQSGRT